MYIFRGRLCGRICDECPEDLANIKIRLYSLRDDQDAVLLATAPAKQTFGQLKPAKIQKKKDALLAETETDGRGAFNVEFNPEQGYDGGAFEIDLVIERVPGQTGEPASKPVQFTLTTLQPQWRETNDGHVWGWDYCLPHRLWC